MKQNQITRFFTTFLLIFSIGFSLVSCSSSDDDPILEAKILSFKITDSGQTKNVSVDGVISGNTITVAVPYESDLTALTPVLELSEGASVVPGSGAPLDFSDARTFVVSNGDVDATYTVNVTKADPEAAVLKAIQFASITTGADYQTELDLMDQTVTVTFNNLQTTLVKVKSIDYGPNGAVSSVKVDDEMDLSTDDLSITISFAGEDKVYDIIADITTAGFDPTKTETLIDKTSASNLVPAEIADNASRGADYNGQYVFVPSRTNGNHIYYYDVTATVFEAKELAMDGVTGGSWAISDVKCVRDAIYACNMVMAAAGAEFKVYKWDNVDDTTPEVVLTWTTTNDKQRLGDALSIVGDPSADGYIMASNFPGYGGNADASEVYVWKATAGAFGDATLWDADLQKSNRIGQYGRVNEIPGIDDKFLVAGAESLFIIDANGAVVHEIEGDVIQGRAMDAEVFEYNGGVYMTYTVNREWEADGAFYEVVNITEGADALEGIMALNADNIAGKTVYKKMLSGAQDAWVNANTAVAFNDNDEPEIFSFSVLSGFIVETLKR